MIFIKKLDFFYHSKKKMDIKSWKELAEEAAALARVGKALVEKFDQLMSESINTNSEELTKAQNDLVRELNTRLYWKETWELLNQTQEQLKQAQRQLNQTQKQLNKKVSNSDELDEIFRILEKLRE